MSLNSQIRKKIKLYYTKYEQNYYESKLISIMFLFQIVFFVCLEIYNKMFSNLPFSLQTQINLSSYNDLIDKVPLFNLGSPFFILSFFK